MRSYLLSILLLISGTCIYGQNQKKLVRDGNKEYSKAGYDKSELNYRRAIDIDPAYNKAIFNLGDALYKQGKYEEAGEQFKKSTDNSTSTKSRAAADYNLANSLLKAGKVEESIKAYKSSLIADPENHKAKYNLAYAQDLLKKQQQQQNDKNKQDNKDKNKQDKQNKDQNQDKQNKEQDQNQNQDKQQNQSGEQDKQQQQQSGSKMTKEDADRLLQALANDEKDVQEKVKKAKAAAMRVKTLKNW